MYYVLVPERRSILTETPNLEEAIRFARESKLNVVITETYLTVSVEELSHVK